MTPFHDVLTTTDARQALVLLAAGQRFDLILCDIRMPEMTGVDFHARLQADNAAQASRVVLMSGGLPRPPGKPPVLLPKPLLAKPFKIAQVLSLMRAAISPTPVVAA
jgi:CheY-like chemotaxis protein